MYCIVERPRERHYDLKNSVMNLASSQFSALKALIMLISKTDLFPLYTFYNFVSYKKDDIFECKRDHKILTIFAANIYI